MPDTDRAKRKAFDGGASRVEPYKSLDDFPTPPWATRALMGKLRSLHYRLETQSVWEPACNRGYMARSLSEQFGEVLATDGSKGAQMRATRAGHIGQISGTLGVEVEEISTFASESPNGNNVSLEDQMVRSSEIKQTHDLALGVYQTSLDILRLSLGRR